MLRTQYKNKSVQVIKGLQENSHHYKKSNNVADRRVLIYEQHLLLEKGLHIIPQKRLTKIFLCVLLRKVFSVLKLILARTLRLIISTIKPIF